jgi:hypothetical protein
MKRTCAVALSLAACLAAVRSAAPAESAPDAKPKTADRAEAVRDKYAKLAADVLKIAEPIEVTEVKYYKDGGSIGLILTDAKKVRHTLCMDGRKRGPFPIVLGVDYPGLEGGRQVEFRGPEETALYAVLLRWARSHPERDYLFGRRDEALDPKNRHLWQVSTFLLRLDRRFTGKEEKPRNETRIP